jgi:abhydrolase domain-containing protein 13
MGTLFLRSLVGLTGLMLLWAIVTVLLQDLKIIPALLAGDPENNPLPTDVISFSLDVEPGVKLEVWEYNQNLPKRLLSHPLLLLHGNGHTLFTFWSIQKLFAHLGFHTYQYDYRGVGKSTGWPSEKGLERDASKVLEEVARRHNVDPDQVAVMGVSLGTGGACFLAQKYDVKRLLLYTPFVDFRSVVREFPVVKYLAPFVWYRFQNLTRLVAWAAKKEGRQLIVVHGVPDVVIPYLHSEKIVKTLKSEFPTLKVEFVEDPKAAHHIVIERTWDRVSVLLTNWFKE